LAEGSSPAVLAFADLPPGCQTSNTLILSCTPDAPGKYIVQVTATGPTGANSTAVANLEVDAIGSTISPGSTPSFAVSLPLLAAVFAAGALTFGITVALYFRRRVEKKQAEEILRALTEDTQEGSR
jgi:hypothetical protein